MRNLSKIFFNSLAGVTLLLTPLTVDGANPSQKRDEALDDLSFTEMINSVELDAKSAELIRKFQDKEGRIRLQIDIVKPQFL